MKLLIKNGINQYNLGIMTQDEYKNTIWENND